MNYTLNEKKNLNSNIIEKNSNKINYKVIVLIIVLTLVDLVYGLFYFDGAHFDIKDGFFLAGILTVGIFSIIVSKRYQGSKMLGKAYLFLGLGFFAWFIGDLGYYYQQFVLDIDPWPSPFDIGYAANYIFAILHLGLNIKYFKPKLSTSMKIAIIGIPLLAITQFTLIAYEEWGVYDELAFDLIYSNIFVIGISTTLAFALVGASVFRNSVLKEVWLLLALGIFLWTVADSIYYYLETIEAFTHNHPINSLWTASFLVMIYALYKHMKAL